MRLLFLLLIASALLAQMTAPAPPMKDQAIAFYVAGNFPRDLLGVDQGNDPRPNGIWGFQDTDTLPIQFYPPAGYRTEILEIHGDLVAGFKILRDQPPLKDGQMGYVLVGYSTSQLVGYPGPEVACNYCAKGCMIYLQGGVGKEPLRIPVDRVFRKAVPLEADSILNLKLASFLNTTGYPIHVEATYSIIGQFVPR